MLSGRRHAPAPRSRTGGFTYLALLLSVALVGSTLAWAGESWQMARQRERERQLLFAGEQIRRALVSYARSGPKAGQFPGGLEELLDDPRQPALKRHLRRIPADPMTGKADWVLITDELGAIVGVHSRSQGVPLKRANFPPGLDAFDGAARYSDWRFTASRAAALPQKGPELAPRGVSAGEGQSRSGAPLPANRKAPPTPLAAVVTANGLVGFPLLKPELECYCEKVCEVSRISAAPGGAGGTG